MHTAPDCATSASRPGSARGRAERRVESDIGANDAEGAGTEQPDAALLRDRRHRAPPRTADRGIGGVRKRHQRRRAHLGPRIVEEIGDGAGRDRNDGEVDRLADRGDGRVHAPAEQPPMMRIDGVHAALVGRRQQVLEYRAAERSRLIGRADQGDGLRRQQRGEIVLQAAFDERSIVESTGRGMRHPVSTPHCVEAQRGAVFAGS